ncbi:MAG: hypothetical protein LBQ42_06470 [Synergistaceae bacterium]|jgi:hypothetical protein|nr:hypothetical protein [Synergistaceae bacterium]
MDKEIVRAVCERMLFGVAGVDALGGAMPGEGGRMVLSLSFFFLCCDARKDILSEYAVAVPGKTLLREMRERCLHNDAMGIDAMGMEKILS